MREESGLSQAEVAERIGLSLKSGKGYISHLVKGRIKNPPSGRIEELSSYLFLTGLFD
uniref:XRE family transcriptional regulator n=1 Tax=candidate division WOR-3 bacterium TaxID=2052148 RepID=A0A7C6EC64_UNCW3